MSDVKKNCGWSFCIVTDGCNGQLLETLIASIRAQRISDYEIIIVGGENISGNDVRSVPFDETIRPKWITRKKNLAASLARYENLCVMHDYFELKNGWYEGFEKFGDEWDVCSSIVLNIDGTRLNDWCVGYPFKRRGKAMIDYSIESPYVYVGGGYFCVKKSFFRQHPLAESLVWDEGEDVEWSLRIRLRTRIRMNTKSIVASQKKKEALPLVASLPGMGFMERKLYGEISLGHVLSWFYLCYIYLRRGILSRYLLGLIFHRNSWGVFRTMPKSVIA